MHTEAICRSRAFTLIELLITLSIITILLTIGSFAFRDVRDGITLAQAKNAILTYAAVARNYAVANHIETMMVINPFNGRFEIWHLNPPTDGGLWDPRSGGDALNPLMADGYTYAPVLDNSAALPLDGNNRPLAAVHPIDYDDSVYRPTLTDSEERNIDNLTWTAFCFDENGKLVTRSRRFATRTYLFRDGTPRLASVRNRLIDESPDLSMPAGSPLVDARDTAVTSTHGFIISERKKMKPAISPNPTPADLINNWLRETRRGGRYFNFSETVVLDRFSGQQLSGGF